MGTVFHINQAPDGTISQPVLYCGFAWGRFTRETKYDADVRIFEKQLKKFDCVYFMGGDTYMLLDVLSYFPNLKEILLQDKIVYAVSAGVSALAVRSFNQDTQRVLEGTGVIPFATIVHYINQDKWKRLRLIARDIYTSIMTIRDDEEIDLYLTHEGRVAKLVTRERKRARLPEGETTE